MANWDLRPLRKKCWQFIFGFLAEEVFEHLLLLEIPCEYLKLIVSVISHAVLEIRALSFGAILASTNGSYYCSRMRFWKVCENVQFLPEFSSLTCSSLSKRKYKNGIEPNAFVHANKQYFIRANVRRIPSSLTDETSQ